MNKPTTQLKDLIHVERGIFPENLCDYIIKDIETKTRDEISWLGEFGRTALYKKITGETFQFLEGENTKKKFPADFQKQFIQGLTFGAVKGAAKLNGFFSSVIGISLINQI